MSLARRMLAATGAAALTVLVAGAAPAQAAAPSGGFANANGIIVELTVLTAVGLPGQLGGSPIDPNTCAASSQSCPPTAAKSDPHELLNVSQEPAASANTINTDAMAQCNVSDAVSSAAAQTEGLTALFSGPAPLITADVIRAQANSDCTKAPNAAGSLFQNVTIAGQAIPDALALNEPNKRIDIPGVATVILNEQHPSANGRGIVVNGLHIIGASPLLRGDLIISHAVSGVVCPNGRGKDNGGLPPPDITFAKDANPSTANAGDTVTYTSTVTNTSTADCDVLTYFDHLDPAFDIVSTDGAFGKVFTTPAPKRSDGGTDVILKPSGLIIGAGKSVTQTFVVKLKADVKPGTYYNNLELFCAVNGDFASGPLAPVTGPAPVVAPPAAPPPAAAPEQLPRTGGAPLVAAAGLLLLLGVAGVRRAAAR